MIKRQFLSSSSESFCYNNPQKFQRINDVYSGVIEHHAVIFWLLEAKLVSFEKLLISRLEKSQNIIAVQNYLFKLEYKILTTENLASFVH